MTVKKPLKISRLQLRVLRGMVDAKAHDLRVADEKRDEAERESLAIEFTAVCKARDTSWVNYYVANIRKALGEYRANAAKAGLGWDDGDFNKWVYDELRKRWLKANPMPARYARVSRGRYTHDDREYVHFYALEAQLVVPKHAHASFKKLADEIDSAVLAGDLTGIQESIEAL